MVPSLASGRASAAPPDSGLPSPEVQAALRVSRSGRFGEAKAKLEAILAAPAVSRADQDEAAVELARIEWRIDGRPDLARTRLEGLIPEAKTKVPALLLLSRMERSLEWFEAARKAARHALESAATPRERDEATLSLSRTLADEEVLSAREGRPAAYDSDARKRLSEAVSRLDALVREKPGIPAFSEPLLEAALLLDDGPAALRAFTSYYLAAGAADSALLSGARSTLGSVLPGWKGPASSRQDREALIGALGEARFFTPAVCLARDPRVPSGAAAEETPALRDLVLYEAYIRRVRALTDGYYRDVARGVADPKAWKTAVERETKRVWNSLSWEGKAPPFDPRVLDGSPDTELGKRFGALFNMGRTGGIENLHAGHAVIDERRTADQYGRHAAIRFVALDQMVSNGYETWMWDGRGAHGGWGDTGFIVQVRPAYAGGGLNDWLELNDPARREKADTRLAEETARDEQRAAENPFAYLPGLALRLRRQGLLRILEEEAARGLSGDALRTAFVARCDRALIESSIFAHEGRHAIDAEFETHVFGLFLGGGFRSSAALEYRAKLSEIAFAPEPRLAFGGILNDNIGNSTPHGRANLKLMKGLVAWMESHRAAIGGLDAGKPLLPQLDRLTDDQLRAAARSLDPMASR